MLSRMVTAVVAVLLLVLAASPAEARWYRAESKRFIVYSDGDKDALAKFVSDLEDYDAILLDMMLVPAERVEPPKLKIYLVGRQEDLKIVRPNISSLVAGFYSASLDDIFFIADRPQSRDTLADDVIYHEYAHHFMYHYATRSYPGWYVEGFAEYFGAVELKDTSFIVGGLAHGRGYTLFNSKWVPLGDLLSKRPYEFKTGEESISFYAQAWLLTHYMRSDPQRLKQLNRYFAALTPDKNPAETWTEVTGDSMDALTVKLRAYARGNLPATSFTRREKRKLAPSTITELSPAAADFVLLQLRLSGGVEEKEQAAVLSLVRARAAKYPGDHMAETTLARAELGFGDFDKGRALIGGLLARDPNDAEALQILGIALVQKAEDDKDEDKLLKEARKYLARAYQANNDDYRTLYYFTQAQRGLPGYPSENTVELLTEAQVRAPQVQEVPLTLASALMSHKRWDEAVALLTPLANDPHGEGAAEAAQDMLRRIKANR
ncbi:MAG: hypothetical protein EON95_03760 [Caulobacteraceae bacterium]|nr:MAG: hypothetical protein EON95_03760 [Caulobacteraceae bacterium]